MFHQIKDKIVNPAIRIQTWSIPDLKKWPGMSAEVSLYSFNCKNFGVKSLVCGSKNTSLLTTYK